MKEVKKYYGDGQIKSHYWVNDNGKIEGECKNWHSYGQLAIHCFYKNGLTYGEYKSWYESGQLIEHGFYHNSNLVDITSYVEDVYNITEREYFLLQITFGYFPIFKFSEI